jgi:hypothetical protein
MAVEVPPEPGGWVGGGGKKREWLARAGLRGEGWLVGGGEVAGGYGVVKAGGGGGASGVGEKKTKSFH